MCHIANEIYLPDLNYNTKKVCEKMLKIKVAKHCLEVVHKRRRKKAKSLNQILSDARKL